MQYSLGKTRITLVQGNITAQETDAIVNAANSSLLGGGGVDGAIHRAGGPAILEECKQIRARQGQCKAGNAVITCGGNLKARWVVHTVGPVWQGGNSNEDKILASAYANSLVQALDAGARSVSFPSISTGAYGYPVELAAKVAVQELKNFVLSHPDAFDELCFVLFDQNSFAVYKQAASELLEA